MSRKLALLLGNGRYEAKALPTLQKPDADVAALAGVLRDPAIGEFDDVTPLLNATFATVRREVARFLKGRQHDDLLLLYFSGHGLLDDRGILHLAAHDTEPDILAATGIPSSFLAEMMDGCRSRRQILILDCCYSGAFGRGFKGAAASPVTAFAGNGLGRVVLTASDSTEFAWEENAAGPPSETSVFTHHLVHGLASGEADRGGDGMVSVDELYDYVYERVVSDNPRQTPGKSSYKQQGDIVLARNPRWKRPLPELPLDLREALQSHLAGVREGAVRELTRFLQGRDPGLASAARKAAEQALEDDSRRVSAAAAEVLATAPIIATAPPAPIVSPVPVAKCVPGEELTENGITYVRICGGTFTMGSENDPQAYDHEKPAHRVTLSDFWLSKTAITNEQYRRFKPSHKGEDNLPVTSVSWDEAKAACEFFGGRLPTEAEWEYAARAGSETAWSFGDDEKKLGDYAWYKENSGGKVQPVGTKKPNAWNLYDMHGNVWEWVSDWYGPYSAEPQTDPSGPPMGERRVLRGGSFDISPWFLRSALRIRFVPTVRGRFIGFRCGRSPRRQP